MDKILQTFDDQWVENALNEWIKDQRKYHLMIRYLVEKGSYPLSILVELGRNLIEIESLKNNEGLIKDLKNSTRFIATAFEAEIAAECVRKGFKVELYPELCGKIPDLKIVLDSNPVYFELTEAHPSLQIHNLYKLRNDLFQYIEQLIPENTCIKLTPNKLIPGCQINQIKNRLKRILGDNLLIPTSFQIKDLIVNVEQEKDEWGKSLSIVIPSEITYLELKRLNEKIRRKVRQIRKPNLGVIIVDATNILSVFKEIKISSSDGQRLTPDISMNISLDMLVPFDKETGRDEEIKIVNKIKSNIKEIFEQHDYSNILAVIVIRSFKFTQKKNEAIIVENPYYEELQLLKEIKGLQAFSRTTKL